MSIASAGIERKKYNDPYKVDSEICVPSRQIGPSWDFSPDHQKTAAANRPMGSVGVQLGRYKLGLNYA